MSLYIAFSRVLHNFSKIRLLTVHARTIYTLTTLHTSVYMKQSNHKNNFLIDLSSNLYISRRLKHKKKDKKKFEIPIEEEDEEEDDEQLKEATVKGEKILTYKLNTLRLDAVAKLGFGLPRNKIEDAFYQSKLRRNGQKVLKKSVDVDAGDEIDLIKSPNSENPNLINVMRITIQSWRLVNEGYEIKFIRDRNLLIENYKDDKSL